MKAIILARVSTEEQKEAGNSLPAQLERMRSYSDRKDFTIIKEYEFNESAYKNKRDEFDKIIEDINNSNEKIAVCFDKVDRLSRNVFDKRVSELYENAIADNIELHFVSEGQIIDKNISAVEKFQFGMSLGLAKYYSDAISDNVKRSAEQRRAEGKRVGGIAPLGYLNTLNIEGNKTIVADPDRSYLIQKLFELYATGNYSLKAMMIEAEKIGLTSKKGNTLSLEAIRRILINPFYYGIQTSSKYEPYAHKYIKLITRELFDKCQEVAKKRSNKYTKIVSSPFIFKGLLTCENCGCSITPERHTKKSGKVFIYYSCTNFKKVCKKEYINEKKLLEPIYELLDRLSGINKETIEYITQKLRETSEMEVIFHKKQIERIRKEEDRVTKRKDKLLDMLLDESITQEAYDKKMLSLKEKQGYLQIELREHTNGNHDFITTVSTVFSLAKRSREIFDGSETEEKRQLLNYLLQNPVVKGKKLYFTTQKPFNMLLNMPKGLVLGAFS